jgi:hypothetical protein
LWSRDERNDHLRLALWHFPRFATTDARLARTPTRQPVTVLLPSAPHGWRLTLMGARGARLLGEGEHDREHLALVTAGGTAQLDRVETTVDDRLALDLDPAGVVMIDAERIP